MTHERWYLVGVALAGSIVGARCVTAIPNLNAPRAFTPRPVAAATIDSAPIYARDFDTRVLAVGKGMSAAPANAQASRPGFPPRLRATTLPPLTLQAIAGGPPWRAVIGPAARGGSIVLRVGDSVAGAAIRRISARGVDLAVGGTTWVLRFPDRI